MQRVCKRHSYVCAMLITLLLAAPSADRLMAQITTARLEGFVKDVTGGVIPGVTVVATNLGTNIPYEALTNEVGLFVLPRLVPGRYSVSCELTGFKRSIIPEVILQVGDYRTVQLTLEPGDIAEEITVTAELPTVDTTSQNIGNVVQERQIMDLPLNGRNAMDLFYLQAGANPLVPSQGSGMFKQQQRGNVDGLRVNANNVTVEGVWAQDPYLDNGPGMTSFAVPLDAVAEFRVVTSSASAEHGRGGGAQINVVYKSGTNEFHGSAYEFNRNTVYNANNFFLNRSGDPRPVFLRNQYGASIGGPIIRDRTFFFFTYEGQKERQAVVSNYFTFTPTARDGIFRYYNKGRNTIGLVDPVTGVPKVSSDDIGTINLLEVDPTRLGFDTSGIVAGKLSQVPLPNNFDIGDGFNIGGYRFTSSLPDDYNQYVLKLDHQLTNKHQINFSGSYVREYTATQLMFSGYPQSSRFEIRKGFSISMFSSFSPNLLNEMRFGGSMRDWDYAQVDPAASDIKGNFQLRGLGSGRGGGTNGNPTGIFQSQGGVSPTFNINENLTWIKGNHTLKGGADVRILRSHIPFGGDYFIPVISTENSGNPADIPALPGLHSNDRALAAQLTNDLTGTIGWIRQDFNANKQTEFTPYETRHRYWRSREFSFFFQDTWKMRPNLTLNLGVRWEIFTVPFEAFGMFAQPVGGPVGILGLAGPLGKPTETHFAEDGGGKVYGRDMNNFAPNVGFTWDPFNDGKSSISANFRMAYDRVALVQHLFLDSNNEGTAASKTIYPAIRFSDPNLYQTVNGKAPVFPFPLPELFTPIPFLRQGVANTIDPSYYTPYTSSWSLRLQRELLPQTSVTIAYVGNKGTGMPRAYNINQIEIRNNGFLDAFLAAQRNIAQNGSPNIGESIGVLGQIFPATDPGMVGSVPGSLNSNIIQGQAARVADQIDQGQVGGLDPGGLLAQAGLPDNFFRLNPQFGNARIVGNLSNSTYHGMKLEVTRRFAQGLYLQGNYTFSKALTDYEGGQSGGNDWRDNANQRLDKTLARYDATHVINANSVYELPIGRGRHWLTDLSGVTNHLLGDWQVNTIFGYTTGWPLNISTGRRNLTMGDDSLPMYAGADYDIFTNIYKGEQIATITPEEKALFSNPAAGSAGGIPYRAFHGPTYLNVDLSLFKDFYFTEEKRLQMRFEFFNVFNHTNFDYRDVGTSINSGSFGNVTDALNPRIIQFAAKIIF